MLECCADRAHCGAPAGESGRAFGARLDVGLKSRRHLVTIKTAAWSTSAKSLEAAIAQPLPMRWYMRSRSSAVQPDWLKVIAG